MHNRRSVQSLLFVAVSCYLAVSTASAQEARLSPVGSLNKLKEGNQRFASKQATPKDTSSKRSQELAKAQSPFAIILTCSDSRVVPEAIFDQGLGDLFVIRLAGNVADAGATGSVEFAVEQLHSPLVVVLGHEECAAVNAAIAGTEIPGDLGWLVKQVRPGEEGKRSLSEGIQANAVSQAAELSRRSVVIRDMLASERIKVVSGVYSLKTGKVSWLDGKENGKDR